MILQRVPETSIYIVGVEELINLDTLISGDLPTILNYVNTVLITENTQFHNEVEFEDLGTAGLVTTSSQWYLIEDVTSYKLLLTEENTTTTLPPKPIKTGSLTALVTYASTEIQRKQL
jgi:hypothetical protein